MSTLADYKMPPYDGTGMPASAWPAAPAKPAGGSDEPVATEPVATQPEATEDDAVAEAVYPDGSTAPLGEDGVPVLEDRSADFPDEAAEAVEVIAEPAEPEFDPSEHTVAEVQAYLAENPDDASRVIDLERAGKARVTLIGD